MATEESQNEESCPYEEIVFDVEPALPKKEPDNILKPSPPGEKPFFDQGILDIFIHDTKEHLESIEQNLPVLESNADAPDQDIIDKVYRAAHSIKGGAGFMQFRNISRLAYAMEKLLQEMRSGKIRPEPCYTEALLKGCDLLKNMLDTPGDSEKINIHKVHELLTGLLENTEASKNQDSANKSDLLENQDKNSEDSCFDREIINVFIAESSEHLENIEKDFLLLESQATKPDQNLINKVFRAIHSIKGSAGMLELKKISRLAHIMEALLQKIRLNEIYPESEYIGALLSGCDLLKEMIENISNYDEVYIEDTYYLLSNLVENSGNRRQETEQALKPLKTQPDAPNFTPGPPKPHADSSDTVRIKVELLNRLMTLAGELVLVRNQQLSATDDLDPLARNISQRMDTVTTQLQEAIMQTRMQPAGKLFSKLPRIVRDISKKTGKQIIISISGDEVELDKTILESLSDPLTHIIRNACDHGIEMPDERTGLGKKNTGHININASHEAGQINIVIKDDGKGIDPEAIKKKVLSKGIKTENELSRLSEKDIIGLIMMPGFSTSEKTTEISGRGVGMDVVKSAVENQGGSVEVMSVIGQGTTICLRLPLTLAIIPCLIASVGDEQYAVPKASVDELVCLYDDEVYTRIEYTGVQEVYRLRDSLLPIVRMSEVLDRPGKFTEDTRSEITGKYSKVAKNEQKKKEKTSQALLFAVVKTGSRRFGLVIDRLIGSEEIVVSPLHSRLKSLAIYSGATITGDGTVALILDIQGIAAHVGVEFIPKTEKTTQKQTCSDDANTQRSLIFKIGRHERFAMPLSLIRRVQEISAEHIETVGDKEFVTIDGISAFILRIDRFLNVSPCVEKNDMYMVLPKNTARPFGILISDIADVVSAPLILNRESHIEDGLLGTAIVQGNMTLFPDISRLLEKAGFNPKPVPGQEESKIRVLAVEDAVFFRRLVKGYLEAENYEVELAENGLKGLELLNNADFDLIVSDIEMPEMDGLTFLRHVRASEKFKNIPAMALTTLDSPEDLDRIKNAGFNAHDKKIDRERLLKKVSQLLQKDF
ncbi:MAG: hybrid sensor histidine kinase/response regulator [Desulfobacteraceae bacterium]|nr:hybrid sensor histidine kinase/response regulator [Desulfobacteraceae bacterium]